MSKRNLFLVAALLVAAPAAGQDYKYSAHWNAGALYVTPLNDNGAALDLEIKTGWVVGLTYEQWLGAGRIGWRANAALTERPLELPNQTRDIGIWMADLAVLLRLLPADPGRAVNAFVAAGGGVVRYGLGRGEFLTFEPAGAVYPGNPDPKLAAVGAFGLDFLTPFQWDGEPVGVRVELSDHVVFDSPFEPIGTDDFGLVHNARLTIGLFAGWGVIR